MSKSIVNIDGYKVGDIFYTSWGYEQTNIEFYQVIKATAKTLRLHCIAENKTPTDCMVGYTEPAKNEFITSWADCLTEFTSRATKYGYHCPQGHMLHKYDSGQKIIYSSYY